VFIEAKDDGNGGDNWSCKSCKVHSPPTNQHKTLQAGCHSYRPTNRVRALKGKDAGVTITHSHTHTQR